MNSATQLKALIGNLAKQKNLDAQILLRNSTNVVKSISELDVHFKMMKNSYCLYGFSGNNHFEGFKLFKHSYIKDYKFEKIKLSDEPLWLNGPAVSKETFKNNVIIYDLEQRLLEAIPLRSERHVVRKD